MPDEKKPVQNASTEQTDTQRIAYGENESDTPKPLSQEDVFSCAILGYN